MAKKYFKTKYKQKLTIGKLLLMVLICLIIYVVIPLIEDFNKPKPKATTYNYSNDLMVSIIDVGQGSSTLVKTSDKAYLIDAGEKSATGSVISYLKSQGITRLDGFIITHLHTDHYAGGIGMLKEIDVDNVYLPETPKKLIPSAKSYIELLDAISKNGSNVIMINEVTKTDLGDTSISFLDASLGNDAPDLNNTSLAIRIDYKDASFLITGDGETKQESKLVDNNDADVDVYVAGHHGSRTSSGAKLLNEVTPIITAISCGENNSYNHPHEEAIKRLDAFGPIYRTDLVGTIEFITNGSKILVSATDISEVYDAAA